MEKKVACLIGLMIALLVICALFYSPSYLPFLVLEIFSEVFVILEDQASSTLKNGALLPHCLSCES